MSKAQDEGRPIIAANSPIAVELEKGEEHYSNHIEGDMPFAIDASADYTMLDGRGGGTLVRLISRSPPSFRAWSLCLREVLLSRSFFHPSYEEAARL